MRKKNIKEVAQNYSLVPQSKDAENRTPDEQAADIARDFNEEEGDNVNANALIKSKQNLEEGDKVISVKQLREMALLTKYNGITLTSVGNILKENDNKLSNLINIADQVDEALKNETYTFRGMAEHILNQNNAIFLKDKKGRKYTADDFSDNKIIPTNQNHKGRLLLKNGKGLATQGLSISRDLSNVAFEKEYSPEWRAYAVQYIKNPDVVGGNFLKQLKEAKSYAEQMDYYNFVRRTIIKDDNNGQILIGEPEKGLLGGEKRLVTNFFESLKKELTKKECQERLDNGTILTLQQFLVNANTTNSDFTEFEKNSLKSCTEIINILSAKYKNPDYTKYQNKVNNRVLYQGNGKPGELSNLEQEDLKGANSIRWLGTLVTHIKDFIRLYANEYNKERNAYKEIADAINKKMGDNTITQDDVKQTASDSSMKGFKELQDGALLLLIAKTYSVGVGSFIKRYKDNEELLITDINNNPNVNIDNAITTIETIESLLNKDTRVEELLNILRNAHETDADVIKNRGANGGESATKRAATRSSTRKSTQALTESSKTPTYIINESQLKELIRIGLI